MFKFLQSKQFSKQPIFFPFSGCLFLSLLISFTAGFPMLHFFASFFRKSVN